MPAFNPFHAIGEMTAVPFDTLSLARKLRETAGFTPEHAEATAEALADALRVQDLVTKADIANFATKTDVAELKADIFKWGVAALIGQAALITALVRLL